jgi:Ser/Thr protein kinase RdoA (MazF antagonist)
MPFSLVRPANDIEQIINRSVAAFAAEVPDRPEDVTYLQQCAAIILSRLETLPQEKPFYGLIHGDVIRANAQVADDGSVSILDFDLCGPGGGPMISPAIWPLSEVYRRSQSGKRHF